MSETLPLTGERTAPGIWHENYWFARHQAAYEWVVARTGGPAPRILDAGCGEGYGAALLGRALRGTVTALDYDLATLRHVRRTYAGIPCVQGNLVQLGLAPASFDLVVSMQTVEHLWDQPAFVAECARVVRPGGTVVVSTPNRLTFPAGNCFHTRELTGAELAGLVGAGLDVVTLAGLWHGPRLAAWESVSGSCVDAQLAGEPSSWPAGLATLVRSVTAADFEIHPAGPGGVDDALDLLVVAGRPTDG